MITNQEIVAQARTWIGARYQHQGRLKHTAHHKGGVDCIGLVLGVADELGVRDYRGEALLSTYDIANYSTLPRGKWMLALVSAHIERIPLEDATHGDVLIMSFESDPQHLGIISDYPTGGNGLIHCYSKSRRVIEQPLTDTWRAMSVAAVRFNRERYG